MNDTLMAYDADFFSVLMMTKAMLFDRRMSSNEGSCVYNFYVIVDAGCFYKITFR